ncbi:MAG: tetratricopeptide repeat protein [Bacteroides sp.]|nr:tetratricopeptide repeat protein [Bacteroides sp.]
MKRNSKILVLYLSFLVLPLNILAVDSKNSNNEQTAITTKQERNLIREGNKLYNAKRFAEAEVAYRKALEALPSSEIAQFNLAASLLRQSGSSDPNNGNSPVATATQILQNLASNGNDRMLSSKSFYNLGNLAFNSQDYGKSIEMYKNALRKNPDDDKARENLRLAQLKQKEQQNQEQNQNQNNQDQNKEQNQDQNQDQNKDQNQDKNNQDQNQDQNQEQNKEQNKDQNKDKQQGGISDSNAEKILKAMENEEAATRKRVEAEKKKAQAARRKNITNPW